MVTLLLFILILGLIVFIHEFGHFIFAKKHGVYVHEFSLGFGPKLFSFRRKNDETEYMIKAIPLGGYVMLAGETEEEPDGKKVPKNTKLTDKGFFQKLSIMVAGVFNNFLLGIFLLFIIGLVYGSSFSDNTLSNLNKDYPLYKAGARDKDKIILINNKKIKTFDDIETAIAIAGEGKALNITVEKPNKKQVKYKVKPNYDKKSKSYYYGISIKTEYKKDFISAIKYSFTKFISIYKSLIIVIISLFKGELGLSSLSGPVGIYQVVGVAKSSLYMILYLTAYLSINVGFMNLLPFPAFDGGRAFLLILEKIFRKKIPSKIEDIINTVGFVLLMILMVFVTIKDIFKLF